MRQIGAKRSLPIQLLEIVVSLGLRNVGPALDELCAGDGVDVGVFPVDHPLPSEESRVVLVLSPVKVIVQDREAGDELSDGDRVRRVGLARQVLHSERLVERRLEYPGDHWMPTNRVKNRVTMSERQPPKIVPKPELPL